MKNFLLFLMMLIVSCRPYDVLIEKDEVCEQKWSDYGAQLQRRADLIPNLVQVVKASAAHENETLKEVMEARAAATQVKLTSEDLTDPEKVAQFEAAQTQLKGSLSRLMMVQENYPDLKANKAFSDLQVQIEGSENRILRSREEYNKAVADYNKELNRLQGNAVNAVVSVAGKTFKPRVYFQASESAHQAPVVDFSKK